MTGAGYLAWVAIHNGPAAGCGPESGCDTVLHSRWAYWFDLPVSVPAVLVYLALLGSTILLQKNPGPDDQRGSWAAIIILSVIVAGAAFWFVSLQVFVIQSFCKYCLTAHACGFAAAVICLMNIPYATEPDTPMWAAGSGKRGVPRQAILSLVLLGLVGVAVLAGGQLLVQKQRNVVKLVANPPASAAREQVHGWVATARRGGAGVAQCPPDCASHPVALQQPVSHQIWRYADAGFARCAARHRVSGGLYLQPLPRFASHIAGHEPAILESTRPSFVLPVTLSPQCNPFIARPELAREHERL